MSDACDTRCVPPQQGPLEDLFETQRYVDALRGRHFEANALVTAPRKWWPEVRRTVAALNAQGIRCEAEEGRGFFSRVFTVRCDDAALPILHELGDRMRLDHLGPDGVRATDIAEPPDASHPQYEIGFLTGWKKRGETGEAAAHWRSGFRLGVAAGLFAGLVLGAFVW